MTAPIETNRLGKHYRRKRALQDCTLAIPDGKVVGHVGPNGAGKTTLLHLAVGLLAPTSGTISLLGRCPGDPDQLDRVGFVAQDTPIYAGLSVSSHLRIGGYLNENWDHDLAEGRITQLDLDPRQKAGSLSGGQRAKLALTLAVAKRPDLLLLVAAHQRLSGEVSDLLASHWRLSGPRRDASTLSSDQAVIEEIHTDKQSTFLVRTSKAILDPAWNVKPVTLEDLVLPYLGNPGHPERVRSPGVGVVR